jgi:hypothetical protein
VSFCTVTRSGPGDHEYTGIDIFRIVEHGTRALGRLADETGGSDTADDRRPRNSRGAIATPPGGSRRRQGEGFRG